METTANTGLKLNYKRTALIGFAFFGILLLWQVYDSWCPTFLTDIFAKHFYNMTSAELKASDPDKILNVQWIVGIIMACDNLAALILLPLFGNLSDKTKTPIGKRMPYILVGTFVSAVNTSSSFRRLRCTNPSQICQKAFRPDRSERRI